jgi:hypothetical protein
MRYVLGPAFAYTPVAPTAEPTSPTGKLDPTIEHQSVIGNVARFAYPAYDKATHNVLAEVRLYLVPDGHPELPTEADGYIASAFPFGRSDVAGDQDGGESMITIPATEPVAHHAQYVLGYDA